MSLNPGPAPEYEPSVGDEVSYVNDGAAEDAHIASLAGTVVSLTIDADSRTESDVPLKQGNFSPLRYYKPRALSPGLD